MDVTSIQKPDPSLIHAKQRYQDVSVAEAYDRVRFTRPIGRAIDTLEKRAFGKALRDVRRVLPHPSVLDIPCGTGRITELLLQEGLTVLGGDISEPMLEIAQSKLAGYGDRADYRRLDVDHLDLAENRFDLITCIRLFNHFLRPERTRALRELGRVSSRFVIVNLSVVSRLYRVAARLKTAFGIVQPKEPWTWGELQQQAADAGLRIRSYYHELPVLSEVLVVLLEKTRQGYRLDDIARP